MSDLINPSVGADFVTITITAADLQGANTGQRPDLLARPGAVYRVASTGGLYAVQGGLLLPWQANGEVDVSWFGASPASEDSTQAFKDAVAHISASNGGTITIPPGTFIVSELALLIITSNTHIKGSGKGVTILKTKASPLVNQLSPIQFAHYSNVAVRGTVSNCSLRDLSIDGNFENQPQGTSVSDGTSSAVRVEDIKGLVIENVEAYNCDGYGFSLVGSNLPHREKIKYIRCDSHDNAYDGFDIKAGASRVHMFQCESINNGVIASIPERDSVGYDLRGSDVVLDGCYGASNITGSFRIRENAGLGIRLVNCTSANSPTAGYGYHLIGSNIGINTLTNCVSFNDGTAFRYRRGHFKLFGCMAYAPLNYGFHLAEDAPATMALTTATVPTTVNVTTQVSVDSATNISVGEYVRISDGTALVEGIIDAISGTTLSVYVTSNTGTGPVAIGAAVTVRNIGSFTASSCTAARAGTDGLTIQSMPFNVVLNDFDVIGNIRYGINNDATNLTVNGGKINNNVRGINFSAMSGFKFNARYVEITDDQVDKRQTYAFVWDGLSSTCSGEVLRCNLAGNLTGVNSGTAPNSLSFTLNTGLATEVSGTTANRPVLNTVSDIGFNYLDTTLGIPVWWNGSVWKNSVGVTV